MKHIHFMGILGSGCSAAAAIAKASGYEVSGCDVSKYSEYGQELATLGFTVADHHDTQHATKTVDMVVVSPAITHYDAKNPELVAFQKLGVPMLTWQAFVGKYLQKGKKVVAIAGTHGKSTTTAMTVKIFEAAGLDPTAQLGAIEPGWQKNYRIGNSNWYIIEADEYGNNFLHYKPFVAAITNVEYDHPEFFADQGAFEQAFREFVANVGSDGTVICPDDVAAMLALPTHTKPTTEHFSLQIPGDFNIKNAQVAYTIAISCGIDPSLATKTLQAFTGLARRFELKGHVRSIQVFDDYGHHPTALLATATAAREHFGAVPIWLVFQPHMFTRTRALFDGFRQALTDAPVDHIILTDIFPSREHDTGLVSSQELVAAVNKPSVVYGGNLAQVEAMLVKRVQLDSIIITMGAGDIISLAPALLSALKTKYGN